METLYDIQDRMGAGLDSWPSGYRLSLLTASLSARSDAACCDRGSRQFSCSSCWRRHLRFRFCRPEAQAPGGQAREQSQPVDPGVDPRGRPGLFLMLLAVAPNTLLVSDQCGSAMRSQSPRRRGRAVSTPRSPATHVMRLPASPARCRPVLANCRAWCRPRMHARPGRSTTAAASTAMRTSPRGWWGPRLGCGTEVLIGTGYSCADCHYAVGHEGLAAKGGEDLSVRRSVTVLCIGSTTGSRCLPTASLCHDYRPSDSADVPAGVTPSAIQCKGCHTAETDASGIECHGLSSSTLRIHAPSMRACRGTIRPCARAATSRPRRRAAVTAMAM